MIEIDRFYNAALADPTTTAEEFRDRADAAQNPQRVRCADSTDERDDSRAPRQTIRTSIPGTGPSLPQSEVQAIKSKLGVDDTERVSAGRPIETRTVREPTDTMKDTDAVDFAVNAILNEISPGGVTPRNETPGDFTFVKTPEDFQTAVGNTFREVGTAIGQSYRETPPDARTPEDLRRTLEVLRKAGDACLEQVRKARCQDANFTMLLFEMIRTIAFVAAGAAILSAVASLLKAAQAFLEAKWTAETAETVLMTREAKERFEEMLEKIKQFVEDMKLKLKLLVARSEDEQPFGGARRVGGLHAPAVATGLQLSSALLVQRRLEDVEKLVAGYERRLKERYTAGDAVKVM